MSDEIAYRDIHDLGPGEGANKCDPEQMAPASKDPWAHRSQGMRCCTCMWFVDKRPAELGRGRPNGRCRRHAPTMSGYPVVFQDDWCGDHKLA